MANGVEDALSNIEKGLSTEKLFWTVLTDPDLNKQYQSTQRNYFDLTSFVPLVLLVYATAVTRSNFDNMGDFSAYFAAAFALFVITTLLFIPYFAARIVVNYIPSSLHHNFIYRLSESWLQLFWKANLEDSVGLMTEVIVGLHLLGRVYAGQCDNSTSVWTTQACNPVANMSSIPGDQVLVLYLAPLVIQCTLRGIRIQALIACSVLSLFFVVLASIHVGGLIELWTVCYFIFFLILLFTVERLQRVSFMHSRAVVVAIKQNSKHELELLELSTNNERQLKEKEIYQLRSLMGNVAHDLKTPLHSIEADLDVLRVFMQKIPKCVLQTAKSEFQNIGLGKGFDPQAIFDSLTATCKFMGMAINRSQDFMKASNNIALVPVMETFELASTLAMSVTCMSHVQSARTIVVHPPDADLCPYIISDKHWLGENALCLLSNAMKYSDDGAVDLHITLVDAPILKPAKLLRELSINTDTSVRSQVGTSCSPMKSTIERESQWATASNTVVTSSPDATLGLESTSSDGIQTRKMILVTVEDSGIGITEEARKNLFQPFKQAQRMAGGTGLGLYSLSKRVEALGGSNGVSDRPDGKQGSRFWFTFPYRPDEAARAELSIDMPDLQNREKILLPESLNRCSILVIDDSPSILKVTSRLLKMNGHVVETAINGFVGLKMLKDAFETGQFDMVLTDLQMPIMDGIEATRRYREFEEEQLRCQFNDGMSIMMKKRLLIVGMSANSDNQSKEEALDSGMDHFIAKPFSYHDLRPIFSNCQSKINSSSFTPKELLPLLLENARNSLDDEFSGAEILV